MNRFLARLIGLQQYAPGAGPAVPAGGPPGVVLVNLGTPSAPEPAAIRRFLKEFLSDPRVVELPRPLWWLILNGIVLRVRPRKIQHNYAQVWMPEGSPLMVYSQRQAAALSAAFAARGQHVEVELGMRYGEPSLTGAIDALRARGCDRILVLPLYPQYAASTTATVFDRVGAHLRTLRRQPEMRFVQRYGQDAGYIQALARRVRAHWQVHGRAERLLMSFHGLPKVSIAQGDPYHAECLASAERLRDALALSPEQVVVTFQSRFGAAEWLQPYTEPTVQALAREGVRRLDVVCPGFAVDCLETLEEIAQGCAEAFHAAGGETLHYIPALNDDPRWIEALADLAERNLLGWLLPRDASAVGVNMSQTPKSGNDAGNARQPGEKELDKAIDETFPASDPISPANSKPAKPRPAEDDTEKGLDDALDDTFPASDPVPLHDPDQPKS